MKNGLFAGRGAFWNERRIENYEQFSGFLSRNTCAACGRALIRLDGDNFNLGINLVFYHVLDRH